MTEQQQSDRAGARALSAATLDAWLEAAQPGARAVYFHGFFAGNGSERLNERLREEEARGMIFLVQDHRRRDLAGHDYLAIRSSRPFCPITVGDRIRIAGRGRVTNSMSAQARAEGERAFRSSGQ